MSAPTTAKACRDKNARGEPCAATPLSGRDVCWHHAPELADQRRLARSKGGKARHGRRIGPIGDAPLAVKVDVAADLVAAVTLENARDVLQLLEVAAADCLALERSLARARTLAYVADKVATALAWVELEARIAALEQGGFQG